jgi:excisionase family DNA binding protein
MAEKLLTIREVAYLLGVNEKAVVELAEQGIISAYKVGGVYLRFQKEQVEQYWSKRKTTHHQGDGKDVYTAGERLKDFFYFYDFYILSSILIIALLAIIAKG